MCFLTVISALLKIPNNSIMEAFAKSPLQRSSELRLSSIFLKIFLYLKNNIHYLPLFNSFYKEYKEMYAEYVEKYALPFQTK